MDSLLQFLSQMQTLIPLPGSLTTLDFIILVVLFFYALEGFHVGFVAELFDFASFILSFLIGLRFYAVVGAFIAPLFSLPPGFAKAAAFFLVAFVSEAVVLTLFRKLYSFAHARIQSKWSLTTPNMTLVYLETANRLFGLLLGSASAIVLLSFFLTLFISLPFSPYLKKTISSSRIGNKLVANTQGVEKAISKVLGGAVNETLTFLTVKPEGDETVSLNFTTSNVTIDEAAERQMLSLLNKERTSRGLNPLVIDTKLREVARAHSKDMFARGYFSHYSPEGLTPFDRIQKAGITYEYAGENLALAPNAEVAMQGLMNSPGHKANILSPNFRKVGIGGIDGGIYGQMFSQEFTD